MKNFRFKITVEAVAENGQFVDPVLIKTIEHTLRDDNLAQFSRLLNHVPFDTTAMFNGVDISHILQDARETIGMSGTIQFSVNEPQVGHDFRYVDSVAIGERVFDISVTFVLKSIDGDGIEDTSSDLEKVGFQYTMLELLKGRVSGMSVDVIGSYHLIGLVRVEKDNIRMVLYRPMKRLTYLQKHRRGDLGGPVFVPGQVIFQMTGDRNWEVLPRFANDQFSQAIDRGEIEVVANVVIPYSYVEERVGKEEINNWIKN